MRKGRGGKGGSGRGKKGREEKMEEEDKGGDGGGWRKGWEEREVVGRKRDEKMMMNKVQSGKREESGRIMGESGEERKAEGGREVKLEIGRGDEERKWRGKRGEGTNM